MVPDESLQALIFPEVDQLLRRVQTGDGCEQSLAAIGFLKLMQHLREVILQDACLLIDMFPGLKM